MKVDFVRWIDEEKCTCELEHYFDSIEFWKDKTLIKYTYASKDVNILDLIHNLDLIKWDVICDIYDIDDENNNLICNKNKIK